MNYFKPLRAPNFKTGVFVDWEKLITNPLEWFVSEKYDGMRVEIRETGSALSREMKPLRSIKVNEMGKEVGLRLKEKCFVEAELFSPTLTFTEIMHFAKSEDVTSDKKRKKYENLWKKTGGKYTIEDGKIKGWPFPGRDVEFVTTWPEDLKFYVFDVWFQNYPDLTKEERYARSQDLLRGFPHIEMVHHTTYDSMEEIHDEYASILAEGGEGLMLIRKKAPYKYGRFTEPQAQFYKMKEDAIEFDGIILDVEEATKAKAGAPKTKTPLGRSKTSQKKEDREPSGLAAGFLVEVLGSGRKCTVSLNGYNNEQKKLLLQNKQKVIGRQIVFVGMKPVKEGGAPRHARYSKKTS